MGRTTTQAPRDRHRPLQIGFVLAESFSLTAFSLFIDSLRLAADEGDGSRPLDVQWWVMSATHTPLRASCGVNVARTSELIAPEKLDYIAVVGGLLHAGRQIDAATGSYLRRAATTQTTLVGLCTGSFILNRVGVMHGHRTCVSWFHHQDFLDEFPNHQVTADRLFLIDGRRITCPNGIPVADLAHHLIQKHFGKARAQKVSQMVHADGAHGGDYPQPHPPIAGSISNRSVRRALLLMEQNLSTPLAMGGIATHLGLSSRQLERLFDAELGESPAAIYRAVRLRYALWLIDNTKRSVTDIALSAGFCDCAHFARQFRQAYGFVPSDRRMHKPLPASAAGLSSRRPRQRWSFENSY